MDSAPVQLRFAKSENIVSITPETGMMVIMPNYLLHWACPIYEGDEKVCIANNLTFVPKNRRHTLVNIV
jgi:hypothetical protein